MAFNRVSGQSACGYGWLTQVEGFRKSLSLNPLEAILESFEAIGIGGDLWRRLPLIVLQRITLATPLSEATGQAGV